MGAVLLIEPIMKFAIALFSAAHAPSSRRALLFAQAALAGGHEIARLFFYQDGVYNASGSVVTPQDEQDLPKQWRNFVSEHQLCLLYTSPSPRDRTRSRMPSSA